MQINRVFINSYQAVCSAASSSDELFQAICDKRSGIETNSSFFDGKIVGIGISKTNLQEALPLEIGSILKSSDLDSFAETLLIVGSFVGGMRPSEEIYFKDNSHKNINPNLRLRLN